MKTDVDTCLQDLAGWFAKNRREMLQPELHAILLKHCESEAEVAKFATFMQTEPGQARFKTLLGAAMKEKPGRDLTREEQSLQSLRAEYEGQKVTLNGKPAVVKSAMQGKVAVIQSDTESAETSWAKLHDMMKRGKSFVSSRGVIESSLPGEPGEKSPQMQVEVWYWKDSRYMLGDVPTPEDLKRDYAVMWRGTQLGTSPLEVAERMFQELNVRPEAYFSQADVKKLQPHPHTSMSVGDIVVVNGQKFLCQAEGWKEMGASTIPKPSEEPSLLYETKVKLDPAQSLNPEELQSLIDGLPDLLDDSKKAASIKRLKKVLADIGKDLEGLHEVESALHDYEGITPEGMTPEEYQDEKAAAFEDIRDALEQLEAKEQEEASLAKEPWQMTREEFAATLKAQIQRIQREAAERAGDSSGSAYRNISQDMFNALKESWNTPELQWTDDWNPAKRHQEFVQKALREGKPVPAEVLKDYAELQGKSDQGPSLLYEPEGCEVIPPQYYGLLPLLDSVPRASFLIEPSAKERKIDEALRRLKEGVDSIQSSAVFREFLLTMSKFHQYSIGNQILIMLQRRTATRVAGFNTWKDLGRSVMAGEQGIMILAPCVAAPKFKCPLCKEGPMTETALRKHLQSAHPAANLVAELRKARFDAEEEPATYFKVVYVFDVSQTQGKPLPEVEVPVLTGAANEELFAKVLAHCQGQGLTVSFESRPGQDPNIKGEYFARNIWVRPEESRAQQLKTSLHETAHYYTESVFGIPRSDAETIAESSAFVVGAHFGFDSGVRSFPYVAVWSQDKKVLDKNLLAIRNVATRLIQALEG